MSADPVVYLDSSALVKLVVQERESDALLTYLREHPDRVSCALARVEVPRAVLAHGRPALVRSSQLLSRVALVALDDALLDDAATVDGTGGLRSLDAIHLAAARALGDGLTAVITYDRRMADAARRLTLPVAAPA